MELGDGVWRCEMDNIVASGIAHKMKYTSKYSNDGKFRINWEPAPGEGNAKVSGGWTIKDEGSNGCSITLKSGGEFEMPMPKLMKNIAEGIVKSELEAQVAIFAERIKAKLES